MHVYVALITASMHGIYFLVIHLLYLICLYLLSILVILCMAPTVLVHQLYVYSRNTHLYTLHALDRVKV
jgi:hypothetical protein